jgi:hypothetical protein
VHANWVQSSDNDREIIGRFFRRFVGEGEPSFSIRAVRPPQFTAHCDKWNNTFQNAVWWRDKRSRLFAIISLDYDGTQLVAGGLVGINFPVGIKSLYDLSFAEGGVTVRASSENELDGQFYPLRDIIGFGNPVFDSDSKIFSVEGSDDSISLSLGLGSLCIYSPVKKEECDNAAYFVVQ